jgi:hypothetical protein
MTEGTSIQDITYTLAASPDYARDGVCFAACGSGLYRSEDGGETWQDAYAALELVAPMATMSVALSPNYQTDRAVFAGVVGGILRSFDAGRNWLLTELPPPPPVVSALVVSPHYVEDGVVLAASVEDGVFRSGDRGARWAAWNFGLLDFNVFTLVSSPNYAQDETLYVGTETGVFYSTNGGRAWRETDFPLDLAPVLSLALSPNYVADGVILAGTASNGLLRSNDGGRTWDRVGEDVVVDAVNAVLLSPEFPVKPHFLALLVVSLGRSGVQVCVLRRVQSASPRLWGSILAHRCWWAWPRGACSGYNQTFFLVTTVFIVTLPRRSASGSVEYLCGASSSSFPRGSVGTREGQVVLTLELGGLD